MNMNGQNHGTEYKIRVKSGDLAAQGAGTMTITPMPNSEYRVNMLLPDATGVRQPLDLTTIERVELVNTKVGWFSKGQWIKPMAITVGVLVGVPVGYSIFVNYPGSFDLPNVLLSFSFWGGLGAGYVSGVYTGTKRMCLARFVVMTQDGRHAVLEGPERVFRFMNGVYAAPNIQLEVVESETPVATSDDPTAAPA